MEDLLNDLVHGDEDWIEFFGVVAVAAVEETAAYGTKCAAVARLCINMVPIHLANGLFVVKEMNNALFKFDDFSGLCARPGELGHIAEGNLLDTKCSPGLVEDGQGFL